VGCVEYNCLVLPHQIGILIELARVCNSHMISYLLGPGFKS
jgi:hypothetical protein